MAPPGGDDIRGRTASRGHDARLLAMKRERCLLRTLRSWPKADAFNCNRSCAKRVCGCAARAAASVPAQASSLGLPDIRDRFFSSPCATRGGHSSCAVSEGGEVYTWGLGKDGQRGPRPCFAKCNQGTEHTRTRTRTRAHTHTHTHAHNHAHARTYTHARTRARTQNTHAGTQASKHASMRARTYREAIC